jgi:hypothetical protein
LVFQSNQQLNTPGDDGTPGFSSYSLLYPINSTKRGEARVLPVFVSQLLVTEALADGGRIASLRGPEGVEGRGFSAYAVYGPGDGKVKKLVILNMKPFYAAQPQGERGTLALSLGEHQGASVKRMTAPAVDEKDSTKVTWAGQSFRNGNAVGEEAVEALAAGERVLVKDSEVVLVTFK